MPAQDCYPSLLARIREACDRVGRSTDSVCLVAVSKGQAPEKLLELFRLGQRDFGENYLQEWEKKRARLAELLGDRIEDIRWHFIGHLQSNKASAVVGGCEWLQTLDSVRLARKLNNLAEQRKITQKVLLEIKWPQEANKHGWTPDALRDSLDELAALPHLSVEGLMAIPPLPENPESSRPYFRSLKSLLDECNQCGVLQRPMTELSMGMSRDFEIAVEESATMIRVGEALFGPRS